MSKKVRVSDESLNVYGFWVKTSGIDMSDFLKNPVMLWNHTRGWNGANDDILPIGVWKDLKTEGTEVFAEPEFDSGDTFSDRIAKKFEKGHLRACSMGIQVLEWSEDPALLKPGQKRPTVIKCRLREISIVDIPANANAVTLYDQEGTLIDLSDQGALQQLPIIHQPKQEMEELKAISSALGLPTTATLADVQAKITELNGVKDSVAKLASELKSFQDQQASVRTAEMKSLLDAAVQEGRVLPVSRPSYEKLFEVDFENAKLVLQNTVKHVKLSDFAGGEPGAEGKFSYKGKSFSELSKEDPATLQRLKDTEPETFKSLYKAQFGADYKA